MPSFANPELVRESPFCTKCHLRTRASIIVTISIAVFSNRLRSCLDRRRLAPRVLRRSTGAGDFAGALCLEDLAFLGAI